MKNYKTRITIRGLHAGGDIPEGAVVALSASQLKDLHGLVEETDEEPTVVLDQLFEREPVGGIDPADKDALVAALTKLGAIVILPHDDGSLDLRDLPASALLSGVLSKIEVGEIKQPDLSLIVSDEMALEDLSDRLSNGLAPEKVAALLLPPPDTGATGEGEQAGADDAPPAKKSTKKVAAQE